MSATCDYLTRALNGRRIPPELIRRRATALGALTFLCAVAILVPPYSARGQAPSEKAAGKFVDVEAGKIYYEECGSGPKAVVLIHDGLVDSAVWDGVWPTFCKNFHTIRYDRRGYGRSPAATQWYWWTDDLFALLRHLKIDRAFLVGSSSGGGLAINFTIEHPKLVEELVLAGAVVDGYGYSDHFWNRALKAQQPLQKGDVVGLISNWTNDKYVLAADHDAARKKLHDLLAANPQDLTHSDFARPTPSALPRLHEIDVPTLILTGDADIPDIHAHAGVIQVGIPGSRRMVIEDAGHLMYLEKPEEFSRVVITFLQENRD